MTKNIVDARQLFLLCALRGGSVLAKNIEPHTWTFPHNAKYLERYSKEVMSITNPTERETAADKIKSEIKNEIPALFPMVRQFYLHHIRSMEEYTLAENDKITWFQPNQFKENNDWDYRGEFELSVPLNEKEEYILMHYSNTKRPSS